MNNNLEVPEQTQGEINLKMKGFQTAMGNGELDHLLYPNLTAYGKHSLRFQRMAEEVLAGQFEDENVKQLQNIVEMIVRPGVAQGIAELHALLSNINPEAIDGERPEFVKACRYVLSSILTKSESYLNGTDSNDASQLYSILGMVCTMIAENRIGEMHSAINTAFPEYYSSGPLIDGYPNDETPDLALQPLPY